MNNITVESLTGPELKSIRRECGYTQTDMGNLINCSRHAVSYWETKRGEINTYWGVPARMLEVLGVTVLPNIRSNTHARGDGVLFDDYVEALIKQERARIHTRGLKKAARHRQPCLAKTRKGHACRLKSEPGRRRCKFHGGMSTGPKTPEGKARIAAAQRSRWAEYRAAKMGIAAE